jgi:hypothetical protein
VSEWPYEDETHEGLHPEFAYLTTHRGRFEDCSSPDCSSRQPVRIPEDWGAFCPHGAHVVVHDPDRVGNDGYPLGRMVDPWPCSQCTRGEFEAAEAARFEEQLPSWEEWNGLY